MFAFFDYIRLAVSTLLANPLRSMLTLLGIVIGVSTVVAMMGLIEGLRIKVDTDMSELGSNVFQVQKWPSGFGRRNWAKYAKRKSLTLSDVEALRELPSVKQVGGEAWTGAQKVSSQRKSSPPNVSLVGGTPEFMENNGMNLGVGRFLTEDDIRDERAVAVVGTDIIDAVFDGENPIGKTIIMANATYTVVGIFAHQGSALGMFGRDNLIAIPITCFLRHYGMNHSLNITIMAKSAERMSRAQDEVVSLLRRRRNVPPESENDFDSFSNEQMTEIFNNLSTSITAATFGVCILSLLVGGIGILNIMLVSVSERTVEIGVRKALGARRRRILMQFTIEAVVLSALGGILGVALGWVVAYEARDIFGIPTQVPNWAIGLGLGVSTGVGLLFGIYPAYRASGLDPALAMRAA